MTESTFIQRLLLHTCCAPCACAIIDTLIREERVFTLFFYNPNIHPRDEYERRKAAVMAYAGERGIPFIDADYDPENWMARVKGLEAEPERGKRCRACFDMRLERAALYAHENGFDTLATTNGIGRWKNMDQVNAAGKEAAARHPALTFWPRNWRAHNAQDTAARITKEENFYRQKYCGCKYSVPHPLNEV